MPALGLPRTLTPSQQRSTSWGVAMVRADAGDEGGGPRWSRWVRWAIGIGAAITGPALSALVLALGHCSAFGGRCPAEPTPLLQDDVFGTVAVLMGGAVAAIGVCVKPDRRGIAVSVLVAVPVGLLAGLVAAAIARG